MNACLFATNGTKYKNIDVPTRKTGCAALEMAYVAAGRYDAFWEFNLKSWDIASGSLIVKEAGGHVGNINKNENYLYTGNIYACNNDLIDELKSKLII